MAFQDNYTGAYRELDEYGLQGVFRDICADIRPFRVVFRYLRKMGYTPAVADTGNPVLIYQKNGKKRIRCISEAKLLYICRDASREAQCEALSNFRRCCAEEDEAEIELIIGLYQNRQNSSLRKTSSRVAPLQQEEDAAELISASDEELIRSVLPEKKRGDDDIPYYLKF